jgi:poly(hydroxyalkanoate) depolymerase family esterase
MNGMERIFKLMKTLFGKDSCSESSASFVLFFLFSISAFSLNCGNEKDTLNEIKNFGRDPGNLKMFLFNPFKGKDSTERPLVFVLHGCSQDAKAAALLSGWNKIASESSFYVVYPEQRFLNNPSSCFNWFNRNDVERGKGEAASIKSMLDWAKKNFKIDTTRIFITGLSAGAAMSVVMLAAYPADFRAGAVFAGGPYKAATNPLNSAKAMLGEVQKTPFEWKILVNEQNPGYTGKYPKLIVYQGDKDYVVNKKNSGSLILQWCAVTSIDTIADTVEERFQKISDITRRTYKNNAGEDIIIYYDVKNLGHQLLIDPGDGKRNGGKEGLFSANKKFHSTYWTAVDFGLVNKE